MRRAPPRPTQRAVAAWQSFASLGTANPLPMPKAAKPRVKRGKQPESLSVAAVKSWARLRGGVLYKNPRGMAGHMPAGMMVGLGPNGFMDTVGYLPVVVTAAMVGRVIGVATLIEVKRVKLTGKQLTADDHQQTQIDIAAAAGCITGTARTAEDCEAILANWRENRGA